MTDRGLLGIDGGGSGCRAALVLKSDMFQVSLGPANVATDFKGAVETLRTAIDRLAAKAGVTSDTVLSARAHLGLAGVTTPEIAARVAEALPLTEAVVTDDRPTTIVGALGAADGAVAAIGTGSFIGRQVGGQATGVGGWGFHLGDQASGAWLARRCLEEVMLSIDGLVAGTDLTRHMLARFGDRPEAIIAFARTARPADLARHAPTIVAAAGAGDPLGRRLMGEGVDYIRAGLAVLGWAPGERLCLTGGLGPAYAEWIGVPVEPAQGSALDGALLLAARRGRA